ncbi:MAG: hypothetical protein APF76_13340 [Desulfitibacter sp. BRH_c19]|nr:MAG: hypothetical protein APF76_13340 [Desulfitibacter sp. BRH_c19]
MARIGGNQHLVRKTNLKLIIETIKRKGTISRAELAKELILSAPSVSSNIDQLLKMDLLREVGEGDSGGGRKPILLEFNKEYGYVIGIDLSSENCRTALGDLLGNIIAMEQFSLPEDKDGEKIIEKIIYTIQEIFASYPETKNKLKAITVGTPGVIDPEANTVRLSPQFRGWDHLPVKQILSEHFQVPVLLKNDINLAALGEAHYGVGKKSRNLAYISVDMGVGAGIILKGKLFEGSNLAAGEIGYMVPDVDMLDEEFDGYGPLEARTSVPALLKQVKKLVAGGEVSIINQWVDDPDKITLKIIKQALDNQDALAEKAVTAIARYLAVATANLQAVLDLDLIIIGGEIRVLENHLLDLVNKQAGKIMPTKPAIIYSVLNSKAGIYGAFAIGLDYVFKHLLD